VADALSRKPWIASMNIKLFVKLEEIRLDLIQLDEDKMLANPSYEVRWAYLHALAKLKTF
jgi:hypothetical protein